MEDRKALAAGDPFSGTRARVERPGQSLQELLRERSGTPCVKEERVPTPSGFLKDSRSRKAIIGYTFPKSDGSAIATPGLWPGQRRTSQSPGRQTNGSLLFKRSLKSKNRFILLHLEWGWIWEYVASRACLMEPS